MFHSCLSFHLVFPLVSVPNVASVCSCHFCPSSHFIPPLNLFFLLFSCFTCGFHRVLFTLALVVTSVSCTFLILYFHNVAAHLPLLHFTCHIWCCIFNLIFSFGSIYLFGVVLSRPTQEITPLSCLCSNFSHEKSSELIIEQTKQVVTRSLRYVDSSGPRSKHLPQQRGCRNIPLPPTIDLSRRQLRPAHSQVVEALRPFP